MSDDRLRRLDALFAEKVLGNTAYTSYEKAHSSSCHICGNDTSMLPKYTLSLDAAWEGAVALLCRKAIELGHPDEPLDEAAICLWSYSDNRVSVSLDFNDTRHDGWRHPVRDNDTDSIHPAEALVLACLRAVGCTEEELA